MSPEQILDSYSQKRYQKRDIKQRDKMTTNIRNKENQTKSAIVVQQAKEEILSLT